MADMTDLERELVTDLRGLGERLVDGAFCTDLYRALANRRWNKQDGPDGAISLSWNRAEQIVNELRDEVGREPMTLAQTGSEGEVSDTVGTELGRLGWHSTPLNTGRHDPAHVTEPDSAPPPGTGEARAPTEPPEAWRGAHDEADERR